MAASSIPIARKRRTHAEVGWLQVCRGKLTDPKGGWSKAPITLSFSGEGDWLTAQKPQYTFDAKLSVPISSGLTLPVEYRYANRAAQNQRQQFSSPLGSQFRPIAADTGSKVKCRALTNLLFRPEHPVQFKDCFEREKDSPTGRALRRIIPTHSGRLSMQNRLFCASLLLAGLALPGHAQLVFQAPDPIALHAGSGEVTFTLSNRGSTAVTDLKLTHGPIVDSATHTAINGAAVALTTDCKNTNLPTNIDPGTTLSLLANLTGISGTSQAEFPILNGTLPLGHSQRVRQRRPALSSRPSHRPPRWRRRNYIHPQQSGHYRCYRPQTHPRSNRRFRNAHRNQWCGGGHGLLRQKH